MTPRSHSRTATPAWPDAVRVVAIDLCTIYASAVHRILPGAQLVVDLFHVVHLAVKTDRGRAAAGRTPSPAAAGAGPVTRSTASRACWCENLERLSPGPVRQGHRHLG